MDRRISQIGWQAYRITDGNPTFNVDEGWTAALEVIIGYQRARESIGGSSLYSLTGALLLSFSE